MAYAVFIFLESWDKVSYDGTDYFGNPKVKIHSKSDNVETKIYAIKRLAL